MSRKFVCVRNKMKIFRQDKSKQISDEDDLFVLIILNNVDFINRKAEKLWKHSTHYIYRNDSLSF